MTTPAHLSLLMNLPSATLTEMAESLRAGALRHGVTAGTLGKYAGGLAGDLAAGMRAMMQEGCSTEALAAICGVLAGAKRRVERLEEDTFLVLSGPDVAGTTVVDTATVVRTLFAEARRRVLISSYVVFDSDDLLAPLAERMAADPAFEVRFIVDLSHQRRDDSEPLPVVANRFRTQFLAKHWRCPREPEFWHDPRAFTLEDRKQSGVMHAKVVIIDNTAALVTSANFTAAAHNRNIEAGLLIRNSPHVSRLLNYFDGLIQWGWLRRVG